MAFSDIDRLIQCLSRLPGLGPRSAKRAALHLIKKKETLLRPLSEALHFVEERVKPCKVCGNLDSFSPCSICADDSRDATKLCVVADVADLWALERTGAWRGQYHVLGGLLSALDGIGPERLNIASLVERLQKGGIAEVVLALGATVEGQTTAHFLVDRLHSFGLEISRLAHGLPMGGELDYLDDGTLIQAMEARRVIK